MHNPHRLFSDLQKTIETLKAQQEEILKHQNSNPLISEDTTEGKVLAMYKGKLSGDNLSTSSMSTIFEKVKGYSSDFAIACKVLNGEEMKEELYDVDFFNTVIDSLK